MTEKKKLIDITDQEIEAIYDAGKEVTVSFIRTLVDKINELSEIVEKQQDEPIVHFDETGIRIEAALHWLHSAGNENYTYYFPHKKRGKKAMDAMGILPNFTGIAVHDHWDSYYQFIRCFHSLCNAHHLRELIFFEEQDEKWAVKSDTIHAEAPNPKRAKISLSELTI